MKVCPFCREPVHDDAIKCRYCGSSLLPVQPTEGAVPPPVADANQTVYVVDRGLVFFAKFAGVLLGIFITVGVTFYGVDVKRAAQEAQEAAKDAQKAVAEVQAQAREIQAVEERARQVAKDVDEARKAADAVQRDAQRLLRQARQDVASIAEARARISVVVATVKPGADETPKPGSNGGPFSVVQLAHLYNFPTGLDGHGQTIGVVELGGGYKQSDLDHYFSKLGRPSSPNVKTVSVDGAQNQPGDPSGVDVQVVLDIEAVGAVAPGANIVVYFAPNTNDGFMDAIRAAVADKVSVLSIAWGQAESGYTVAFLKEMDQLFKTAAENGTTVLAAAGDRGVTDGQSDKRAHVDFPASDPWVLAVGGTKLKASGDKIVSEVVWNDASTSGASATGGGFSEHFPMPEWQSSVDVPVRADGSRGRGIPDVVANASPSSGYEIFCNGQMMVVGGTAASTPLWAGFIALINQGVGKNVGHLNPLLYRVLGPSGACRPITEGDNGVDGVKGYPAGRGWSAAAGWGSPDGEKILETIRTHLAVR